MPLGRRCALRFALLAASRPYRLRRYRAACGCPGRPAAAPYRLRRFGKKASGRLSQKTHVKRLKLEKRASADSPRIPRRPAADPPTQTKNPQKPNAESPTKAISPRALAAAAAATTKKAPTRGRPFQSSRPVRRRGAPPQIPSPMLQRSLASNADVSDGRTSVRNRR